MHCPVTSLLLSWQWFTSSTRYIPSLLFFAATLSLAVALRILDAFLPTLPNVCHSLPILSTSFASAQLYLHLLTSSTFFVGVVWQLLAATSLLWHIQCRLTVSPLDQLLSMVVVLPADTVPTGMLSIAAIVTNSAVAPAILLTTTGGCVACQCMTLYGRHPGLWSDKLATSCCCI